MASAARWRLSTPSIASSSDRGAEKDGEHVGLVRDVERAHLVGEPLLGLGQRAPGRGQLPARRRALPLQGREPRLDAGQRRFGAPELRLEGEELEPRLLLRGAELGAAGAKRVGVVGEPRCGQPEKRADDEQHRKSRGWEFPLHRRVTVSEDSRRS